MSFSPNIEHFGHLKMALEQLFGASTWLELKRATTTRTWQKHATRLIGALELAVVTTVSIRQDGWLKSIEANLLRGRDDVRAAESPEDVIDALVACLTRHSFLQLGNLPQRSHLDRVALAGKNWDMSGFYTVLVVQTPEQKEAQFMAHQRREIGFEAQLDLQAQYRTSGSKLPYSQWCDPREG